MRQRTEARHLLYFTIMILHLSPTAPHKTGPPPFSKLLLSKVKKGHGAVNKECHI